MEEPTKIIIEEAKKLQIIIDKMINIIEEFSASNLDLRKKVIQLEGEINGW
jgi:hypothetical protein